MVIHISFLVLFFLVHTGATFVLQEEGFPDVNCDNNECVPTLVDLDSDGDLDLLLTEKEGIVHIFENSGNASVPHLIKRMLWTFPPLPKEFDVEDSVIGALTDAYVWISCGLEEGLCMFTVKGPNVPPPEYCKTGALVYNDTVFGSGFSYQDCHYPCQEICKLMANYVQIFPLDYVPFSITHSILNESIPEIVFPVTSIMNMFGISRLEYFNGLFSFFFDNWHPLDTYDVGWDLTSCDVKVVTGLREVLLTCGMQKGNESRIGLWHTPFDTLWPTYPNMMPLYANTDWVCLGNTYASPLFWDVDDDGDLDILVIAQGQATLLRNTYVVPAPLIVSEPVDHGVIITITTVPLATAKCEVLDISTGRNISNVVIKGGNESITISSYGAYSVYCRAFEFGAATSVPTVYQVSYFPRAAAPVFYAVGSSTIAPLLIHISSSCSNATIHVSVFRNNTLMGVYDNPSPSAITVVVPGTIRIVASASAPRCLESVANSTTYYLKAQVSIPTIDPPGNSSHIVRAMLQLACAEGSRVVFSVDGGYPKREYNGTAVVVGTPGVHRVRAVALRDGWAPSTELVVFVAIVCALWNSSFVFILGIAFGCSMLCYHIVLWRLHHLSQFLVAFSASGRRQGALYLSKKEYLTK
jgi:hypothetical protein